MRMMTTYESHQEKLWNKIRCPKAELQLPYTLAGGQSFRWRQLENGDWRGVFYNRVWTINQCDHCLMFKVTRGHIPHNVLVKQERSVLELMHALEGHVVLEEKRENEGTYETDALLLAKYLRLHTNLRECYLRWAKEDPIFRKASEKCFGVRLLYQDPLETIFSFICSSNNNIKRITYMIEKLCALYGREIGMVDDVMYHDFPTLEKLIHPSVEDELRKAGFGYRAKFIHKSACMIKELGGEKWISSLKKCGYKEAKVELMKLPGVGEKVSDCICLMGLGYLNAIPVDTHIFKVACEYYMPHLRNFKGMNQSLYSEIVNHFLKIHGPDAGWAQTVLFCADLKSVQGNETETKVISNGKKKRKRRKIYG